MKCPNCSKEVKRKDMKKYEWEYCEGTKCRRVINYHCPDCGWIMEREVKYK